MHGIVHRTTWLTPQLIRVELTGGELASFEMPPATDAYINVAIPPQGAAYGGVFDPKVEGEEQPRELRPVRRRYTVREWDPENQMLTVDFVVHGDHGVGGPWAANAQPGDVLVFQGPSGGYQPDTEADWHLLVGDESALPAIAASCEAIRDGVPVVVRLLCDGPDHEVPVAGPDGLDLAWLHRSGDGQADAQLLPEAIHELEFPEGRVHAFIHGEAGQIREIRKHLLGDRGLTRADMSCSPYWRQDMTDEAWRAIKKDFVKAMESDLLNG